jgi:hypothetical protein
MRKTYIPSLLVNKKVTMKMATKSKFNLSNALTLKTKRNSTSTQTNTVRSLKLNTLNLTN